MNHMSHHSFRHPSSFTVKHLMADLIGVALSPCLLLMGASCAVSNLSEPEDQGKVGQEDEEFRDLIFDRTNNLWTAKESGTRRRPSMGERSG